MFELLRQRGRAAGRVSAHEGAAVAGALAVLRAHTDAVIVLLAETRDDHLVVRASASDVVASLAGLRIPDLDGVGQHRSAPPPGAVTGHVGDTPELRRLASRLEAGLGTYVAAPVILDDVVQGVVCCVGRPGARVDASSCVLAAAMLAEQLRQGQAGHHVPGAPLAAESLLAALSARDKYTGEHSQTVVRLARGVALELDLDAEATQDVEHVALLHDVGKLGIPDGILRKPGPLDEAEWAVMRSHPVIGARIVGAITSLARFAPAIAAEHERWDGAGYPAGLSGTDIPMAARIILACDAFDAMTTDRPYRRAMTTGRARRELRRHRGTQFEPVVVDALERVLDDRSAGLHLRIVAPETALDALVG